MITQKVFREIKDPKRPLHDILPHVKGPTAKWPCHLLTRIKYHFVKIQDMDEILCCAVFLRSFNVLVCLDNTNFFMIYVISCVEYCRPIFSTIYGCISINIILLSYLRTTLQSQCDACCQGQKVLENTIKRYHHETFRALSYGQNGGQVRKRLHISVHGWWVNASDVLLCNGSAPWLMTMKELINTIAAIQQCTSTKSAILIMSTLRWHIFVCFFGKRGFFGPSSVKGAGPI